MRIANYLCNGNYAISGGADGCQAVQDLAKSKGARMTVKLAVAGAFHTSYMQPAQEELEYASTTSWPCPHVVTDESCLHAGTMSSFAYSSLSCTVHQSG